MAPQKKISLSTKKKKQDIVGYLLLLVVILVVAGIGFLYYKVKERHVPINIETLCPKEGLIRGIIVILFDRTDPLNTVQQAALRSQLEDIRKEIKRRELLEIYSVGSTENEMLRPKFSLCSPGQDWEVNKYYENPGRIEKRWKEVFKHPLDQLFKDFLKPDEDSISPIMESIQSIAITTLEGSERSKIPKRLIIVSDMLQNTLDYSHYEDDINFQKFRLTEKYKRVKTNLFNVKVEIIYVYRPFPYKQGIQGERHLRFWEQYIKDQGGEIVRIKRLEG